MGQAPEMNYLPARNEVKHAFSNHDKLRQAFGDGPHTSLEEGIARMAAWAREAGPRRSKPFQGIEIAKNMPPSWRAALAGDS
jgi:UDP-glucose 4-epimerase